MSFNEWMAYIYRMNGHAENKIKQYEQSCRSEVYIPQDRWTAEGLGNSTSSPANKDSQNPKED